MTRYTQGSKPWEIQLLTAGLTVFLLTILHIFDNFLLLILCRLVSILFLTRSSITFQIFIPKFLSYSYQENVIIKSKVRIMYKSSYKCQSMLLLKGVAGKMRKFMVLLRNPVFNCFKQ